MLARRSCFALVVALACGEVPPSGTSSTESGTTASAASTNDASEDVGASASSEAEVSTSESSTSDDPSSSDGGSSSGDSSTGAPVPDFDDLPWQTGDEIGYGVAYKDSQDPSAHSIFIGYAGYPFPL